MRIIITHHTRVRIAQRRISENQVRRAIIEPDRVEDADDGCKRAIRQTDAGNFIHVIYEDKGETIVVVTAYRRDA